MMRRLNGRRAWTGIERDALGAFAADKFVGLLAHVAFGKAGHGRGNAVGHPVINASTAAAFGVDHQKNEGRGTLGHVAPGELRRDVIADAIRIIVAVCFGISDLLRHHVAVGESGRFEREDIRSFSGSSGQNDRKRRRSNDKKDFLIMVVPLCFRGAQAASDVHINPIAAAKFLRNGTRTCEPALAKCRGSVSVPVHQCPLPDSARARPCERVLANMPWISFSSCPPARVA
jgi:hypothetical protein